MRRILPFAMLVLSGCASVQVHQLNADLTAKAATPEGMVYYLPRPYLLVARLPVDVATSTVTVGVSADDPKASKGKGAKGGAGSSWSAPSPYPATYGGEEPAKPDDAAAASPTPVPSSATDLSFGASNDRYILKLIYLPDLSHPMSISAKAGWFGSVSLQPTLADGWMLTGLQSQADSKGTELLSSAAALIGSLRGGAAPPTGPTTTGGLGGGAPQSSVVRTTHTERGNDVLPPGLYEFNYVEGRLVGLCQVGQFSKDGVLSKGKCPS